MTRYDDQMPDVIDAEAWAASEWIEKQQALCSAATDGPWMYGGQGWVFGNNGETVRGNSSSDELRDLVMSARNDDDGTFAAAARTSLPKALAALRAVLREHQSGDWYCGGICDDSTCTRPHVETSDRDEYVHEDDDEIFPYCVGCSDPMADHIVDYPCLTVRAILATLDEDAS